MRGRVGEECECEWAHECGHEWEHGQGTVKPNDDGSKIGIARSEHKHERERERALASASALEAS